jgi:polyhydroxyalkanoate synthesis regulator phasin
MKSNITAPVTNLAWRVKQATTSGDTTVEVSTRELRILLDKVEILESDVEGLEGEIEGLEDTVYELQERLEDR